MKVKVIDPKGLNFGGKLNERGAEIEIPKGAKLDAALHFKQVAPAKEAAPKSDEPKK